MQSEPAISVKEIEKLYDAKQKDNQLPIHENSKTKFIEYCHVKCVDRKIKLSEQSLGIESAKIIS
jgi:hypothetical protein